MTHNTQTNCTTCYCFADLLLSRRNNDTSRGSLDINIFSKDKNVKNKNIKSAVRVLSIQPHSLKAKIEGVQKREARVLVEV